MTFFKGERSRSEDFVITKVQSHCAVKFDFRLNIEVMRLFFFVSFVNNFLGFALFSKIFGIFVYF